MKRKVLLPAVLIIGAVAALAAVSLGQGESRPLYATVHGDSMDRWATGWLLTEHISPNANLQVVEEPSAIKHDATRFDIPGGDATYQRDSERSAFEVALAEQENPTARQKRLAEIVHAIEVAYWQPTRSATVRSVADGFRNLQRSRDRVPPGCYMRYFESVAQALGDVPEGEPIPKDQLLRSCEAAGYELAEGDRNPVGEVAEMATAKLLEAINRGDEVIFVDVREPGEFGEGHIPGALNIPIYQLDGIDDDVMSRLKQADYVVPYCIKDFRGFEMAKILERRGVDNSVIMNPYGLKGWRQQQLPLAGGDHQMPDDARAALKECLDKGQCGEVAL